LFNLLRKSVYYSRFVLIREHVENQKMIHEQHRAILEAISAHDPEAARAAANLHLNFLLATIRETKNSVDLTQMIAAGVRPRQAQRSKAAKTRTKDAD
jgi:GntR family transcriptional repressor for pyruvate dehydrogenase complex